MLLVAPIPTFFFFNDTATTEIYTLSLHDALPISAGLLLELDRHAWTGMGVMQAVQGAIGARQRDRKSTRLNSSHSQISYAVFCLKKKKLCNHSVPYTWTCLRGAGLLVTDYSWSHQ